MKPKAFAALAVATVACLALAITTYAAQNRWAQAAVSGTALFPTLAAQAGNVAKVELKQGDNAIILARGKEGWTLADRANYPAKAEAVRALIVKLAQAELVEAKTRNKDRYALLELEEPGGKDAKSRQLRLLDDKGAVLADAVIGKRRYDAFGSNRSGTYVRKPGDAQTWLSNADLDLTVAVKSWVNPGVLDIAAAQIGKVIVEMPGEEPLTIERDGSDKSKYTIAAIPDGKKLKAGAGPDSVVRAAGNIEMEDVRKAGGAPGTDAGTVKLEGDGGLAVTLKLRKDGEDSWVSIEASGSDGDAKKTADEVNARAKGWEFKIPAHKAQSILKKRDELFEAS
jgi:hypothetical protein